MKRNTATDVDKEIVFSKAIKAGKRIYYLDGWLEVYDNLEHIKPEWTQILSNAIAFVSEGMPECKENSHIVNEREYEYEHLLVYYIYRYFLRAVFDEKLSEKVKPRFGKSDF